MRVLAHILFAIVALQLAFGLQVAVAHVPHARAAQATSSEPCSMHNTAPERAPVDKHDCCKLSGSQCQCSGLALAVATIVTRAAPIPAFVSATRVARPASVPADSRFRPPIAL